MEFSGGGPLAPRPLIERSLVGTEKVKRFADSESNLFVYGENLYALTALQKTHRGRVSLVYIDPPFNAGKEFVAYDDRFQHSVWLSFMEERLKLMWELLEPGGSLYVHLDFNEVHYCKVLLDEITGSRSNFQREIIWRIGWISGYKGRAKNYIRNHDTILYYTKGTDPAPVFNKIYIPYPKDYERRDGKAGKGKGIPMEDTWNCSAEDRLDSIQIKSFSKEKTGYLTQKNEDLLERIISVSTKPGGLVLDAFAGGGTTGAAAHKLGRRWIMVEENAEARQKIEKRLAKVVAGTDRYGITAKTGWKGGGGYRSLEVGEQLMLLDEEIQLPMMNRKYEGEALIKAVCQLEGFTSPPVDDRFHGQNGYHLCHVALEPVDGRLVAALASRLPPNHALTIYGPSIIGVSSLPRHIAIRKLDNAIMSHYVLPA